MIEISWEGHLEKVQFGQKGKVVLPSSDTLQRAQMMQLVQQEDLINSTKKYTKNEVLEMNYKISRW